MKLIPYLIPLAVGLQFSTSVLAADATNEAPWSIDISSRFVNQVIRYLL